MTARRTPVDPEFVLHAEHVRVVEVQKIRRTTVRIEILLQQLKTNARRVFVALGPVVDRRHITVGSGCRTRHRLAEIMRESRDSAQARKVVAEEGNAPRRIGTAQECPFSCCRMSYQTSHPTLSNRAFRDPSRCSRGFPLA